MKQSIKLEIGTKKKLDELKDHPDETYQRVIQKLLRIYVARQEYDDILSAETIKNIQNSLADIKAGKVSSHKDVKQRLGLK